jgi:hypothetical protein
MSPEQINVRESAMSVSQLFDTIEEINRRSRDPNAAMTFKQWCIRNTFSPSTGRRIIDSDDRPDLTWFSPGRFGITFAADDAWKARRTVSRGESNE